MNISLDCPFKLVCIRGSSCYRRNNPWLQVLSCFLRTQPSQEKKTSAKFSGTLSKNEDQYVLYTVKINIYLEMEDVDQRKICLCKNEFNFIPIRYCFVTKKTTFTFFLLWDTFLHKYFGQESPKFYFCTIILKLFFPFKKSIGSVDDVIDLQAEDHGGTGA